MSDWHDLADDELLARLVQKGVSKDIAEGWVRHRDEDDTYINDAFEGYWP